jgi:membrane associated rhomboid family serine protease
MCAVARVSTCPKCRALLEPGTRVCPYCGTKPGRAAPPPVSEEAAATSRLGLWVIGIILVIYFLMVVLYPTAEAEGMSSFEPSREALLAFGLSHPALIKECGQTWRLVTAIFLHLGIIHLLFNSIAIFILVPPAAVTFGPHRTACLFLVTGVLASWASHAVGNAGGGASGAVCGLIGALALYGWRRGGPEGRLLTQRMVTWGIVILVYGFMVPRVDNVAHGAGFVSGAALGYVAAAARVVGGRADRLWRLGAYASISAVVAVGVVWLLPNVIRSFERREVELYLADSIRLIRLLEKVEAGEKPVSALPESSLDEGPAQSGDLTAALDVALQATRKDPSSEEAKEARFRAWVAVHDWHDGVYCSHAVDWPDD